MLLDNKIVENKKPKCWVILTVTVHFDKSVFHN